jgi:hypothetical protein
VDHLLTPFKYLWAFPTTAVGLLFAMVALASGGRGQVHSGVYEVSGGAITVFLQRYTLLPSGAAAITFGHVVLGQDATCLERTRAHERVHVRQAERWGPFFLPAYMVASLVAKWRGGDAYRDNAFEREAFAMS